MLRLQHLHSSGFNELHDLEALTSGTLRQWQSMGPCDEEYRDAFFYKPESERQLEAKRNARRCARQDQSLSTVRVTFRSYNPRMKRPALLDCRILAEGHVASGDIRLENARARGEDRRLAGCENDEAARLLRLMEQLQRMYNEHLGHAGEHNIRRVVPYR